MLLAAMVAAVSAVEAPDPLALEAQYARQVRPLLQRYCWSCHDDGRRKGGISLEALQARITPKDSATWTHAKDVLDVSAMPPEGKPQPTREERDLLIAWIAQSLQRHESENRENRGGTLVRRINQRAYGTMMRTLLDVPVPDKLLELFPEDGTVHGYDTVGSGMYATADLYELYQRSAAQVLDLALPTGPKPEVVSGNLREGDLAVAIADRDGMQRKLAMLKAKDPRLSGRNGKPSVHIEAAIMTAIAKHYQSRKDADPSGTTATPKWQDDPAIIGVVEEVVAKRAAEVEQMRQGPAPKWALGAIYRNSQDANFPFTVPVAGHYLIRARLWNTDPEVLLPVRLRVGERIVARFLPAADAANAKVHEHRLFLTPGKIHVGLRVDWESDQVRAHLRPFSKPNSKPKQGPNHARSPGGGGTNVVVDEFEISGPHFHSWPPPATQRVFFQGPDAAPTREYAEEICARFLRRATAEVCDPRLASRYADLIMAEYAATKDFAASVKHGLAAILASPRFLYLLEAQREQPDQRRTLSGAELARRLAYAFWSDLPDEALGARAASGELLQDGPLRDEVRRMLLDPRSRAFREAFTRQWLHLDKLASLSVPIETFPLFDEHLREEVAAESVAFFSEILDRDLGLTTFIASDFAMLNQRLAHLYGIPGVVGPQLRRVPLPAGSHRGGVLTQASVLMVTGNGMVTSPVLRGVLILERFLGEPPGAPPPNVPALDRITTVGEDGLPFTARQRLALHREVVSCARCHDRIDPLGLAFEHYDAMGRWLEQQPLLVPTTGADGKVTQKLVLRGIVASGAFPDGVTFDGPDELRRRLLERKDRFLTCFVENLMIYVLGRELQGSDRPIVAGILARSAAKGHGLRSVLEELVLSEAFRTK